MVINSVNYGCRFLIDSYIADVLDRSISLRQRLLRILNRFHWRLIWDVLWRDQFQLTAHAGVFFKVNQNFLFLMLWSSFEGFIRAKFSWEDRQSIPIFAVWNDYIGELARWVIFYISLWRWILIFLNKISLLHVNRIILWSTRCFFDLRARYLKIQCRVLIFEIFQAFLFRALSHWLYTDKLI